MAEGSTSPGHATRTVATTRGVLTYAQLAPLLAERVLAVEQQIAAGDFQSRALDGDFTRQLHAAIAGDLVPDWAGQWRTLAVAEGRLLSVHPFRDFNGRVTRLFLRELLRRLDLPPVDLVPTTPADEPVYLA